MTTTWRTVRCPDGRDLEVLVAGPEDGLPLLYHSGTPTAASPLPALTDAATERGLRTVCWSRPGYATSTARPGRTVAAVADDAQAAWPTWAGTGSSRWGGRVVGRTPWPAPPCCRSSARLPRPSPASLRTRQGAWTGWPAGCVDKAALTGDFAEALAETFRRAVSTGVVCWHDDDLAFVRP